eukprot:CAMPEP_0116067586 /NCGR_PEP_ID=MMETSP0322-20121206/11130_1 /TAXON_ID=163516 /ORGANISM="Leptocylindrus danicus var. apora, Strain B651" /LENGTH=490 /DNA_ID=CAMNT_0003554487 /DNA_START=449 /DNA_END=1921 /DNA_ORIENTATION=-
MHPRTYRISQHRILLSMWMTFVGIASLVSHRDTRMMTHADAFSIFPQRKRHVVRAKEISRRRRRNDRSSQQQPPLVVVDSSGNDRVATAVDENRARGMGRHRNHPDIRRMKHERGRRRRMTSARERGGSPSVVRLWRRRHARKDGNCSEEGEGEADVLSSSNSQQQQEEEEGENVEMLDVSENGMIKELKNDERSLPPSTNAENDSKRVTFRGNKVSQRPLYLVSDVDKRLFKMYMRLPPESYSLLSFDESSEKEWKRRWHVRRLNKEESKAYRKAEFYENYFANREGCKDMIESRAVENVGNYFRFSIPLKPLTGIDLTPTIDVIVYSPGSLNDSNEDTEQDIFLQSVKVSLLERSEDYAVNRDLSSTSMRTSLEAMSPQAIEAIEKLGEVLMPHVQFSSRIFWQSGCEDEKSRANRLRRKNQTRIGVDTRINSSLFIPNQIPIPIPSIIISKFCSTVTERVLSILMPRLLKRIEIEFGCWKDSEEHFL